MPEQWTALAGFLVFCYAAAASAAFSRPGPWYWSLEKPPWNPPDWLFGPVWMVLYGMIAASGWLVWREAGLAGAAGPLVLFVVQILLNAAWSPAFFTLKRIDVALAVLTLLWLAVAATLLAFWPIHTVAGWLLVPYLAWVSFAWALNFAIWRRNGAAAAAR